MSGMKGLRRWWFERVPMPFAEFGTWAFHAMLAMVTMIGAIQLGIPSHGFAAVCVFFIYREIEQILEDGFGLWWDHVGDAAVPILVAAGWWVEPLVGVALSVLCGAYLIVAVVVAKLER